MSPVNLVEVLDLTGKPTDSHCIQQEAHARGWWHAEATLCVTNGLGHVLQVQQCAEPRRETWDLFLVRGDVWTGESPVAAIWRLVAQQFGASFAATKLQQDQIRKVCVEPHENLVRDPAFPRGEYWHRVHSHVFVICLSGIDERELARYAGIRVRRYPKWQLEEDLTRPDHARVFTQHVHRLPAQQSVRFYRQILAYVM